MKIISYLIVAFLNVIRLSIVKIFHFRHFHFKLIQLSSPKFSVKIAGRNSNLYLGNRVCIKANTSIEVVNGQVSIGNNVFINRNCMIVSMKGIRIGDNTTIGPNVLIYDHDHTFGKFKKETGCLYKMDDVVIGKNVWIGGNVSILRGTQIGDNCVIGAGTIVKGNIESGMLVTEELKYKYCKII